MPPKASKHPRNTQGLVNPGTKVTHRKSNHSLRDAHANGNPKAESPILARPVTPLPNGTSAGPARGDGAVHCATDRPAAASKARGEQSSADEEIPIQQLRFTPPLLAMDSNKAVNNDAGIGSSMSTGTGTTANHKGGSTLKHITFAATTILTSCPQRDVIAMLILLLQLSSPVLFAVDFLFAVMTSYVPKPSSSAIVIPSFQTLFEGAGGAPSLATVVLIDIIFFGLWVFMPLPVRNIGLDLAQAVIALSFSGAATSKNGTTNSAVICLGTIFLFRTLSHRPTRQYGWQVLWTKLLRQPSDLKLPPDPGGALPYTFLDRPSLPRTIVGVHILAQGVLRVIRRSVLAARDGSAQITTSTKRLDPEAALAAHLPRNSPLAQDKITDGSSSSPTETRAPGPLPSASEALDKALAGKRKKKQATMVRSQQPFWAALAHTKVTVANNMEQNHLVGDASEASATDIDHMGNANFLADPNLVWITKLEATEIGFGIAMSEEDVCPRKSRDDFERSDSFDNSAPFYVRVNGANWSSTRFAETDGAGSQRNDKLLVWVGEIFGLTPLCNYVCEFVRTSDDLTVYKMSLITQPAPYTEQAPAPAHQALRPSSPTTTLKNSIAAAEARLHEQRNKLRRNRKDHKAATTAIKREVDRLSSGLASAGGQDERLKHRATQLKQTVKQAEEATAAAEAEAKAMGEIPEDEFDEHRARKRSWQKQLDIQNAKRSEIDAAKAHQARECSHVEAEIATAVQKRERLQLRQAKLGEQHDRLERANAQDADAKQRRLADRQSQAINRANLEQQYLFNIQHFEAKTQELRAKTVQAISQSQHLEALIMQQAQVQAQHVQSQNSTPTTPEGPLPGTAAAAFTTAGNRNSFPPFSSNGFQFPVFEGGNYQDSPHQLPVAPVMSAFSTTHRGRSSSMLSAVSGFTDDLDDAHAPAGAIGSGYSAAGPGVNGAGGYHGHAAIGSNDTGNGLGGSVNFPSYSPGGRNSSGEGASLFDSSGSGSASGSQRDPTSPPPLKATSLSPIGTRPAAPSPGPR